MSFLSLKKSTQSDKTTFATVDQFIEDAVAYANGINGISVSESLLKLEPKNDCKNIEKMKNATFTLNQATTNALNELSEKTGISKSRIIRILVQNHYRGGNVDLLNASLLK